MARLSLFSFSRFMEGGENASIATRYHTPFMKLTFWGAAGAVTGSMHLLETGGKRILLDCGLNQGKRKEADAKNRNLPFAGSTIDEVVLSHAHIDHSGNLPTLVK